MIVVEIQTNADKILAFLRETDIKLKQFKVPLKEAGLLMIKSIDTNFKVEGRPNRWKPLKPATIKRKRSSAILQDTGTLKNSMSLEVKGTDAVSIGTTIEYATTHNFGSKERKIPQRKFMLFQEEDKKRIDSIFLKFMGRALTDTLTSIG